MSSCRATNGKDSPALATALENRIDERRAAGRAAGTLDMLARKGRHLHVVHQKQGLGYSRGTGMSGCLERYEHDGIVRMCLHDVADHAGPHADADGCWLVDGKVTVVDPVYRARWSSDGAWWI